MAVGEIHGPESMNPMLTDHPSFGEYRPQNVAKMPEYCQPPLTMAPSSLEERPYCLRLKIY